MKKEWILNEDQLRRRKNSRLNTLKSSHGFQQQNRHQNNNLQQQFSPNFSSQNCHFSGKNPSTNVFSSESGILSPKSSKSAFISASTNSTRPNAPSFVPNPGAYESMSDSPQSSNSSVLLDLADYGGLMVQNGAMRPRNGSAGSSAFFGSRTSSHCSVELPTINSPLSGNPINPTKVFIICF